MSKAKEMQQMAGGTWDKLEQVFEDRVARALSKLGVYTQNDVQRLAERVDELANSVNALLKSGPGQRATGSARKTSKRAAKGSSGRKSANVKNAASKRGAAKTGR